MGHFRK